MARTLAAALRHAVNSLSRRRGELYMRSGRVGTIHRDSGTLTTTVRGTRLYDVSLTVETNRLIVNCTCPFFQGSLEPCKHIWATILAADSAQLVPVTGDLVLDVDASGGGWGAIQETARAEMPPRAPGRAATPPDWQTFLSHVTPAPAPAVSGRAVTGEVIYVLDLARSATSGGLLIDLLTRERKKSGDWTRPKTLTIVRGDLAQLPDEQDRRILEAICGAMHAYPGYTWGGYTSSVTVPSSFVLNATLQRDLAPRLCETGRLFARRPPGVEGQKADAPLLPVAWDPQPAAFHLRITGDRQRGFTVDGGVTAGGEAYAFDRALFMTDALILWQPAAEGAPARLATFEAAGADRWVTQLLRGGPVTIPPAQTPALVEALATADLAHVDGPDELRVEARVDAPRPMLRIARPKSDYGSGYSAWGDRLEATLSFVYGDHEADPWSAQPVIFDRATGVAWRRDREAERQALARLHALGVRRVAGWRADETRLDLAETALPTVVRVLLTDGWSVEAEGRRYRRAGALALDVKSGIDWLELHGAVDFEGTRAELPALLAAAKRGDRFVALGDGTFGLLPQEWLERAARMASLGAVDGDHIRFGQSQAALLDAWLETQPTVSCDAVFARARAERARFDGIRPIDPPPTFTGVLRDYQRDALGWFDFLRRFGFGGCLADEMGLGKTVMVLATLEARRLEHERLGHTPRPSVIVVPRSLVFNWRQEAARFAPALRVLDFTGADRRTALGQLTEYHIILTTYGTLRRDIGDLKDVRFDYAILDEAQAIKNPRTSASKAARLLQADHRLALSGTPIENHLGELWSLFDFLNPGILGAASIFAAPGAAGRAVDDEMLALIARGLRPFILRRTKEQVARELPARTEQTLYCDLDTSQRALYDELRDHYRAALLGKAGTGLGGSKLQILEALLRLRQAACHPALVDRGRAGDPSAKLDLLVPRLQELVEDGRQVLVFSQFTSFLALLRTRLDEVSLTYEYLDGRTRDREARVQRFQQNSCPLFLISLKAGGLGLNLTAADYVFLLDPWWNPAVEAQAIDRAHRMGQTQPVFAFRLVARNTIEDKVLELQAGKRRLADAIVRADDSLIRDLRREDLDLLLS